MGSAALAGLDVTRAGAAQADPVGKWDHEAEIVVLGIGGAGLMTAITARDQGADVLILEKAPEAHAGGNILECIVFGRIAGEHAAAKKSYG